MAMDYSKLEEMPSMDDEEEAPESKSEAPGDMNDEQMMFAKELGFTGDKALALKNFVKSCYSEE